MTLMGQPSDVDTPIYDQLVLEVWPDGVTDDGVATQTVPPATPNASAGVRTP